MRRTVPSFRTFLCTVVFISVIQFSFAQSISTFDGRLELGASVGPMIFLGDLGGNPGKGKAFVKDINWPVAKMSKGLYATFYPDEWFGFRLAFNHGQVEGADSLVRDSGGEEIDRKIRNLHFRSNLIEGYGAIEVYPTVFYEKFDGLRGKFRPYALLGVGLFHFNPQGAYTAADGSTQWVDLQPLHLEGQGMEEYPDRQNYSLTQIEIPFGVGFKFYVGENAYLGLEILHRKTFTDYIDDVSTTYIDPALYDKYLQPQQAVIAYQMYNRGYGAMTRVTTDDIRGNKNHNDSFVSSSLKFGWRIGTAPEPRFTRCPRF